MFSSTDLSIKDSKLLELAELASWRNVAFVEQTLVMVPAFMQGVSFLSAAPLACHAACSSQMLGYQPAMQA